jgi:hypothetical protein
LKKAPKELGAALVGSQISRFFSEEAMFRAGDCPDDRKGFQVAVLPLGSCPWCRSIALDGFSCQVKSGLGWGLETGKLGGKGKET